MCNASEKKKQQKEIFFHIIKIFIAALLIYWVVKDNEYITKNKSHGRNRKKRAS